MTRRSRVDRLYVALLLLAALVCVVVSIIYFTLTPGDLPGFLPGHVSKSPSTQHYWKRGAAALLVALALLAVVAILGTRIRSTFRPTFFQLLVGVAALGLLLRVAYVVAAREDPVIGDGRHYHYVAGFLADGKGFISPGWYLRFGTARPDALHSPAWPLLLSLPTRLGLRTYLEQQFFACMIGATTIVTVGLIGRRLAGVRAGLIAAALAALYPNFWRFERELRSETLVLLGSAVAILLAFRFRERPSLGRAAALGSVCGVLALIRGEQVLLFGLLLIPLVLLTRGPAWPRRVGWLAVASMVGVAVIVPWAAYNTARFAEPVFLSTELGVTLHIANTPTTYRGERLGYADYDFAHLRRWKLSVFGARESRPVDDSTLDLELRRESLNFVRNHLSRVPVVVLAREGRTWGLFRPFQQMEIEVLDTMGVGPSGKRVYRFSFFAFWLLAPAAAAGALILRRRNVTLIPLMAPILTVITAAALTYGFTRLRASAEVSIVLLSAVTIAAALRRLRTALAPSRRDASSGPSFEGLGPSSSSHSRSSLRALEVLETTARLT